MQQQVVGTLAYSDIFGFPLTGEEVFQRLITSAVVSNAIPHRQNLEQDSKTTLSDVKRTLKELKNRHIVTEYKGYFSLRGKEETTKLVERRQQRLPYAQKKWQEARFAANILAKIPTIKGVAVTGSLAVNNPASLEDDIDFLLVTSQESLWITRPLVILVAFLFGKRRSWQGEEQNSWCFNAWLTTQSLNLEDVYPEFQPNGYHAFELLQAVWLVDKGEKGVSLRRKQLELNPWVNWFVSVERWYGKKQANSIRNKQEHSQATDTPSFWQKILSGINSLFYTAQLQYMRPHMTTERVTKYVAFFHPRPTQKTSLELWEEKLHALTNTQPTVKTTFGPWQLPSHVRKTIMVAKKQGKTIAFVTGFFDLLHQEHKTFLKKAKAIADILLVGVETDARARTVKGEGRPVETLSKRVQKITNLSAVDAAFPLPEAFSKPADHEAIIALIRPDFLAVSSHTKHLDKKQAIVEKYGGEVKIVHDHNPDVSTTILLSKNK